MISSMPQAPNWLLETQFERLNFPRPCLVLSSSGLYRLPPSHSILSCKSSLLCCSCTIFSRHTCLLWVVLPIASLLEEGELPPWQRGVCCTSSAGAACSVQFVCLHQDLQAGKALCMETGRIRKHLFMANSQDGHEGDVQLLNSSSSPHYGLHIIMASASISASFQVGVPCVVFGYTEALPAPSTNSLAGLCWCLLAPQSAAPYTRVVTDCLA